MNTKFCFKNLKSVKLLVKPNNIILFQLINGIILI